MIIGPKYHHWTFEKLCENLRKKKGVDIDPTSIKEYLENNGVFPAGSPASLERGAANRQTSTNQNIDMQLDRDAEKADREGNFDPKNTKDGRNKTVRAINLRRGRPKFRKKVLEAYGGRCAVTNCDCPDALEAAHIIPYRGDYTNHVQNGILLRSDIHTLFDIGRIGFVPGSHEVIVFRSLKGTVYGNLKGRKLRLPSQPESRPNEEALRQHLERCGLKSTEAR